MPHDLSVESHTLDCSFSVSALHPSRDMIALLESKQGNPGAQGQSTF